MAKDSALEQAYATVYRQWTQLTPVKDYTEALTGAIAKALGDHPVMDAAAFDIATRATAEFTAAWPHQIPEVLEMAQAHIDGKLEHFVTRAEALYKMSRG